MFELISNARIYSPASIGLGHVLICAGKIIYVGRERPFSGTKLGPDLIVKEYDLEGKRLVPGFIDGHSHISGGGGETGYASKVPPVPLSEFTRAGVTSVVGLLGTDDVTRNTSELISKTMALREEGISAWCYTGGYHYPLNLLTDSVLSDIVHIECVIGIGELAISDHRSSHLSSNELIRIASQAHVAGLMTGKAGLLHLHLGDSSKGLDLVREALYNGDVPARIYNPTHVNRQKTLFDEACELTGQGCSIDLTAFPVLENDPGLDITRAVTTYIERGLPNSQLTISSDGGGCLPSFNQQGELIHLDFGRNESLPISLKDLLDSGLSLEQVLPFYTSNVAKLLRLKGKGHIAIDQDADLVSIDENHEIQDVMCLGKWHMKNKNMLVKGMFQ